MSENIIFNVSEDLQVVKNNSCELCEGEHGGDSFCQYNGGDFYEII